MNIAFPTVAPQLVAAMIASAPERVRLRLDRTPNVATSWNWQAEDDAWLVQAGGETVSLPRTHVVSIDQLNCSCLLSPRCFHVLACLTRLEVAIIESDPIEGNDLEVKPTTVSTRAADGIENLEVDVVETDDKQLRAARELADSVALLLQVGVAHAGVFVQSGLLRAVHQCRSEGLHRLAALGLRVIAGTSEIRARAPASDPAQLAEDIANILETSRHVLIRKTVAAFWIGSARRKQIPVRPRKLHGLFAEPIITRSGFAGAAVYFLGEDDQIYTASDVRPGDARQAREGYLGGIEIGSLIQPAKQLARNQYLGTDLTASSDGRLGRGKDIKIVEQGVSTWQAEPSQKRFLRPLSEQWNSVFAEAAQPLDARRAGWDFVFLTGSVVGTLGAELLFHTTQKVLLRFAISNEHETLCFRENLRMLSHAPGLRLQVIARVKPQEPKILYPLAIAQDDGDLQNADEPRLEIPKPLSGRVCLGLDEIHRHWLIRAQASPAILNLPNEQPEGGHALESLRRRWIAAMLSGMTSQRMRNSNSLAAETTKLYRMGFTTGASLLGSLCDSDRATNSDTFLATAVYLRTCICEFAKTSLAIVD